MERYAALLFPVLVAALLQGLFVGFGVTPVLDGGLYGPDAYMRLVRVSELVEGAHWFEPIVIARSNPPFGTELHWTRPLDLLLLAGAAPLLPFLGFRSALYWSGVAISPLLQVATLVALYWGGRPLFDRRGRVLLAVIFLCQPAVYYPFMAGRPDHHSLLALLFALSIGLTLRLIHGELRPRLCLTAGLVLALDLWVGVEALVPVAVALCALGLLWIWRGGDFAAKSLLLSLALVAGAAIALAYDPPAAGPFAERYDRLSVVYLTPLALVALFWAIVATLERRSAVAGGMAPRAAIGAVGVVAVLGLSWLAFPEVLAGSFAGVDPRVLVVFRQVVEQSRPLLTGNPETWRSALYWLGPIAVGLPYLVYRGLRGDAEARRLWLYLLAALAVFLGLTVYSLRWATYYDIVLVFPVTGLLVEVLALLSRRLAMPWRPLARALAVIVLSVGFVLLGAVVKGGGRLAADGGGEGARGGCPVGAFAAYANGRAREGPQRILASAFYGPELLWRTALEVIAVPYAIRSPQGVWDAYRVMSAADDGEAHEVVVRRGITWILLCPGFAEEVLYRPPEPRRTFYQRLASGAHPGWLAPLELPPELAPFRLYEVVR